MIPTRTRLSTWHPDKLLATSRTVKSAGDNVERAASDARTFSASLPASKDWTGIAHDAAQSAFDRGFKAAAHIADGSAAVSAALVNAFHAVSRAKRDLLDVASDIEASGKLTVDDHWVVQLAAIAWTEEEIEKARAQQAAAQTTINERVAALGLADDLQTLLASVASLGFGVTASDGILPGLLRGGPPRDEAPNPSGAGLIPALQQQELQRRQWEATTPRKVNEEHVAEHDGYRGYTKKTLEMQDGSRQEITTVDPLEHDFMENPNTSRRDEVSVSTFAPDGQRVSTVSSWKTPGGTKYTQTDFSSGTSILMEQTPDGLKRASIDVGDFSRDIPTDSEFWAHPVPDTVGAAVSGLEKAAGVPDGIPSVSAATASKIEVGARYAGPAIGIATALVDVYAAPTLQDKCVAGVSSLGALGGGAGGGELGAVLGSAGGPIGTGLGAGTGGLVFGWIGSKVGTQVGELVCR